jgi:hypothetical protein
MDHEEAVRLQAAAKYVLGELTHAERDSFEEHYFDCGECALDVRAAASFVDNTRNMLSPDARELDLKTTVAAGGGRLSWFKPVVAVPAFAVLLLALGYQSLVSVPHWKNEARQAAAPRVLPMYSLIAANTRGPEGLVFHVRPGEPFGLYVDVPADAGYRTYVVKLVDPERHSTVLRALSYEEAQKTQVLEVNPGNHPGAYQLVVLGETGEATEQTASVLATMRFTVEFRN